MKRFLTIIVSLLLVLSTATSSCFAQSKTELAKTLDGLSAILIDMSTGDVLFEDDADEIRYPASTTKMLTGIIILENMSMDKVLIADAEVQSTIGDKLGKYSKQDPLMQGDQITVYDALRAMLIQSCNECAVVLAKGMSGTVEQFAVQMNKKAAEIGCTNTHFENPNGLPNDKHVTTARDLATIAKYCMQNEDFRKIVSTIEDSVSVTRANGKKETIPIHTTNALLYDDSKPKVYVRNELVPFKYEGTIGVKTGNTQAAGSCMVAAATRDDLTLICVVLKSTAYGRFADCMKMFEWGFENYDSLTLGKSDTFCGTIKVKHGEFNKVDAVIKNSIYATVPAGDKGDAFTTSVELEKSVKAPIAAGDKLGTFTVYKDGEVFEISDIVAAKDVKEGGILSNFGIEDATAHKIFKTLLIIFLVLLALLVIFAVVIIVLRRRNAKKKAARKARLEAKRQRDLTAAEWESYKAKDNADNR